MPILQIGDAKVTVGDDFLKLSPEQQQATVDEISSSLPAPKREAPSLGRIALGAAFPPLGLADALGSPTRDISVNDVGRANATGVPILGGLANKFNAATNAALAPALNPLYADKDQLKEPTWTERYQHSVRDQEALDKSMHERHPVADTVQQTAGGVAATLPLMAGKIGEAAFGIGGKVLPATVRGTATGATIGAADALTRGEDPATGGVVGGITGGLSVPVGRGIGRGIELVRDLTRAKAVPVPQRFMDVNGEAVPVRESVQTGNADTSLTEQARLNGGGPAQEIARAAEGDTAAAMERAHGNVSAGLDPTSAQPRATPLEAGQRVARDLVSQEQTRAAAEVQRLAGVNAERDALGASLEPPSGARPGATGATSAPSATSSPFQAMQAVTEGLQARQQVARTATRAAYDAKAAIPGEFSPRHLLGAGDEIRTRLDISPDRVMISPDVTPSAARALQVIDHDVSGLRFPNDAARGARPITPADMEQTRKQLVILRRQANTAARQTGNWEDARAMGRVIDEFTDFTNRVARKPGGFSGDPEALIAAGEAARAAHASERAAFSRRGPGDQVGTLMENILGKYPGQEARPNDLVRTLFGSPDSPGGSKQAVAQLAHLRDVLGETSSEWTAIRKSLLSHLIDPAAGGEAIPLAKQAARIQRFLSDTEHSGTLFSEPERARLQSYADSLGGVHDAAPANQVEKIIARWSGRTDGIPASGKEVIDGLLNADKGTSAKIARELKGRLSPESLATVRQGLFSHITEAAEGATPYGYQKMGERLAKFLSTELAHEMFTPNQRMLMKGLADAYHKLVPVAGTTNPSGSAIMGKKMMTGLRSQVLGMLGFSHGGLPGATLGLAADRALTWRAESKAAKEAVKLFYGDQPKPLPSAASNSAPRAAVIAAQAIPARRANQSR